MRTAPMTPTAYQRAWNAVVELGCQFEEPCAPPNLCRECCEFVRVLQLEIIRAYVDGSGRRARK